MIRTATVKSMDDRAYYPQLSRKTRILNMGRSAFKLPVLECWLAKVVSGHAPTSFWGRMVPPEYLYAKGAWRSIIRNGVKYRLDISNTVDYWTFWNFASRGDMEVDGLIKPDSVIVDIGANIGTRALDFARLAPQGMVIAFEPDPDTYLRLLEHIEMNNFNQIKPINKGVGPEVREEILYRVVDFNPGMNRIMKDAHVDKGYDYRRISMTPLAPVLAEQKVGQVNMIKIDVEGFELEVLAGCEDVIDMDHPVLFIELDDDNLINNGSTAKELVNWVEAKGYKVKIAGSDASLPSDFSHCHFDILCRQEDR